jgi:hypothetical protein
MKSRRQLLPALFVDQVAETLMSLETVVSIAVLATMRPSIVAPEPLAVRALGDRVLATKGHESVVALVPCVSMSVARKAAHKIGKLCQKRLVGRPALIGNDRIATLRRTKAHQENTYHVEVSTPGKSNPHNPHIPQIVDQEVVARC